MTYDRLRTDIAEFCKSRWNGEADTRFDERAGLCRIACLSEDLPAFCEWLGRELGCTFATLVAEELPGGGRSLSYVFFRQAGWPWVVVEVHLDVQTVSVPSLSGLSNGPSVDWHEREVEDLFGIGFEGHPRLGDFVLHEDWPDGVNPMRRSFDAKGRPGARREDAEWSPPTVLAAPGGFVMPIGPVCSDFAESANFLLETVGEEVVRTIPRFFYKYRGVEKIAEGQRPEQALLLAERFSGTAAVAHGLAFCQAVETVSGVRVPQRAAVLRAVLAELERIRHHAAAITGLCTSTALAVAASQAALIEEDLLRLSAEVARHRYLFGLLVPGGLARDLSAEQCVRLAQGVGGAAVGLRKLHRMLSYSSSFLDRLEQVGIVTVEQATAYGLLGPVARASGIGQDMRKIFPYAAYGRVDFDVPVEPDGDGYARLRVLFAEVEQAEVIISQLLADLPGGPIRCQVPLREGTALVGIESPAGAAFHWLHLGRDGAVLRYRMTPPSFANWHGFHLAAENFAFQDFPIILASFGLSNAECDR